MCKKFSNFWYKKLSCKQSYMNNITPTMRQENELLYEASILLGTNKVLSDCKSFPMNYIASVKGHLTVNLQGAVIKSVMESAPATSADSIINNINTLYEESIDKLVIDPVEYGEIDHSTDSLDTNNTAPYKKNIC